MPPFLAAILANAAASIVAAPFIASLPDAAAARAQERARRELPGRPGGVPLLLPAGSIAPGLAARARELRP